MRIQSSAVLLCGWTVAMLCSLDAPAQEFPQSLRPTEQGQLFADDETATADEDSQGISQTSSTAPFEDSGAASPGIVRMSAVAEPVPEAQMAAPEGNPNGYPYGYEQQGYGYPAGADPGAMQAWPGISPFDNSFSQTINQRGLWFNNSNNNGRRYLFNLEYIKVRYRQPEKDTLGAPNANPFDPNNPQFFPSYDAGAFTQFNNTSKNFISGDGLRFMFGIENPDDSFFTAEGFWIAEAKEHVRPQGRAFPGNLANTLKARGGIPLDDGLLMGGLTAPYDTDFYLEYKSQAYGGDLNWFTTPFFGEGKGLKFRGLYGLKYLAISENFHLMGKDSGLAYNISSDGSIDPNSIVDLGIPPYQTDVFSQVRSNLAGPEIGLRYDIGGSRLKFYGATRLAATVNNERISLFGQNLGDGFSNPFPPATPTNPHPTAFSLKSTHTHVSPVIDTALFVEVPLFEYIPVVRKTRLFQDATFRLGWNYIWATEIARPTRSIVWKTPAPNIRADQSLWTLNIFSFGVNWKF